ncbi:hypothetical protein LEMLEM_LOCUS11260, partial [Lemmus lemmus]
LRSSQAPSAGRGPRGGAAGRNRVPEREGDPPRSYWKVGPSSREFPGVLPRIRPVTPRPLSSLPPSRSTRSLSLPPAAMEQPPAPKSLDGLKNSCLLHRSSRD